jgi:hypothetical protein
LENFFCLFRIIDYWLNGELFLGQGRLTYVSEIYFVAQSQNKKEEIIDIWTEDGSICGKNADLRVGLDVPILGVSLKPFIFKKAHSIEIQNPCRSMQLCMCINCNQLFNMSSVHKTKKLKSGLACWHICCKLSL